MSSINASFFSRASLESAFKVNDVIFQPRPAKTLGSNLLGVASGVPQATLYPFLAPSFKAASAVMNEHKAALSAGPLPHPADGGSKGSAVLTALASAVKVPVAFMAPITSKPSQALVNAGLAIADIVSGKAFNRNNPLGILESFAQIPIRIVEPFSRPVFNALEGLYNVAVNALGKPEQMRGQTEEALALNTVMPQNIQWAGVGAAGLNQLG